MWACTAGEKESVAVQRRVCDAVGRALTAGWAPRGESKVARAVPSSLKYARFPERTDALPWMTSGLGRWLELAALVNHTDVITRLFCLAARSPGPNGGLPVEEEAVPLGGGGDLVRR